MNKIKVAYWLLCQEYQRYLVSFINCIPGYFGISARRHFYKRRLLKCGLNLHVESGIIIQKLNNCDVGDNVILAEGCYLNSSGKLSIGSNVFIGFGTKIWTDNHLYQDSQKPFTEQGFEYKPVKVEDDVYIGAKCFIKPGVTVGKGSVLKDGTVLAKSVPPFAIVQGNPGIIVGWRNAPPARKE